MVNLLSKGLGYASVPAPPDRSNLSEDLLALARHIRIAYHFRNSRRPGNKHPFKPKSQWIPRKANKVLEDYIEATIVQPTSRRRILHELVIKKADKGSCIIVQDRSTYISEGSSHLADASTYKSNPTASIDKNIGE